MIPFEGILFLSFRINSLPSSKTSTRDITVVFVFVYFSGEISELQLVSEMLRYCEERNQKKVKIIFRSVKTDY